MDHIDYSYVRVRTEEMLARLGDSEAVSLRAGAYAAASAAPVVRRGVWSRVRRYMRLRRRSIRVLPDPVTESGSST